MSETKYKHVENIQDDELKYKKKKNSSTSKAKSKARHKHEYSECLLVDNEGKPYFAHYCKVCGKINDLELFQTKEEIKNGKRVYVQLTNKEVFDKYKNLKQFDVYDCLQKYVSVD